jgi:hypothetical protein
MMNRPSKYGQRTIHGGQRIKEIVYVAAIMNMAFRVVRLSANVEGRNYKTSKRRRGDFGRYVRGRVTEK